MFEGNIAENWKKWKQKFNIYLIATGLDSEMEIRKVAVLLHVIGEEAIEKFNTFRLNEEDSKRVSKILDAFDHYCMLKTNESVDRHIFFTRSQQPGESFNLFLTELKGLSLPCGFDTLRDGLIRDRIISGIQDVSLKNRLLQENDLDLDKCIRICKAFELVQHNSKLF